MGLPLVNLSLSPVNLLCEFYQWWSKLSLRCGRSSGTFLFWNVKNYLGTTKRRTTFFHYLYFIALLIVFSLFSVMCKGFVQGHLGLLSWDMQINRIVIKGVTLLLTVPLVASFFLCVENFQVFHILPIRQTRAHFSKGQLHQIRVQIDFSLNLASDLRQMQ